MTERQRLLAMHAERCMERSFKAVEGMEGLPLHEQMRKILAGAQFNRAARYFSIASMGRAIPKGFTAATMTA